MHLSQRASCKIFKPCLKMFERAEPPSTSSNPQCRAQGRLKTPEVVCFPCLCDVMKFMGILPIEIWISKWYNLFVGKTSKSVRTSAKKTRCWVFVKWTCNLHKAYFRHLQVYFTLMPPDFIPQTKSTTYVKKIGVLCPATSTTLWLPTIHHSRIMNEV